ncbi:AsnC family transcriptional regulator [Thalassomonas viridans]|uniref:Siroheme decarboxylase NirG subunit n=1 Tax=Thalassomonas viridans TaxID=137584 RepID=A0AAF0CD55_9GAMM|nr:AsnC family transcriptional regulator [Thalassomonas viridans]WDE07799.1 AsnC family transcriptional regulator [Thalassomonas viridans]
MTELKEKSRPHNGPDTQAVTFDPLDKALINLLQRGLPVNEAPFASIAEALNTTEQEVLSRLNTLLAQGVLSRFGPMYDAACLGGAFTLAAMAVPAAEFDHVCEVVNGFEQIAHNYQRNHRLNMWFVIATESETEIATVIEQIEAKTGIEVLNVPKLEEFYVGLYLPI